eukprot:12971444-Alexandrium_andersonii.AAC.1
MESKLRPPRSPASQLRPQLAALGSVVREGVWPQAILLLVVDVATPDPLLVGVVVAPRQLLAPGRSP